MVYKPNLLRVTEGGTGLQSLPKGSLVTGSSVVTSLNPLAVGSDGQVLIGKNSDYPAFASLISTDLTIAFAPGPNTLDIQVANPILISNVTLTRSNIVALRATPIEVVAAPGAGITIHFLSAQLKLVYGGSNVFTNPQDLAIRYTNGSGVIVSSSITGAGFEDQAVNTYTSAVAVANAIVPATGAEAKSLVIHNTGASEITGNAASDNTIVVTVYYQLLTQ